MALTAKQVRACTIHLYYEGYSDGAMERGDYTEEIDWGEITSSLNILEQSCTIRADSDYFMDELYPVNGFRCSNCDTLIWDANPLNYCPVCGAKVVKQLEVE